MNLMKLLTVGQSLKEGKTVLGKYKLMQPSLLPKFVCTIRPTKAAPVTQAAVGEAKVAPEILPAVTEMKREKPVCVSAPLMESRPPDSEKTQKIPAGTVLKRVGEDKVVAPRISFPIRIRNKISLIWKKWFPPRSRKRTGSIRIQTEWTLEKIKVARNDLSDADLEVISRKATAPKLKPKPTFAEVSHGKNHGQRWIKMTARLFKRTSPFEKTAEKGQTELTHRQEVAGRI